MSKPDGMFDEALLLFFDESREMLQQMESALLTLKAGQGDIETIHAMFRCAHTIKGTSGIFNMDRVVKFTHQVESVLDRVRKGKLASDPELCEVLFSSCDMIAALLDQTEQHCQDQGALAACDAAAELLIQRLSHFLGHVVTAQATPAPAEDAGHGAEAVWHISLRFHEDTFRNGFDPLSIVQYLKTLGQIVGLAVVEECLPDWDSFDPESCSLGFEIRLRTEATKLEIESAFEFIGDDCTARIIPPTRRAADYIALMAQLPDEQRLGDILVGCGGADARSARYCLNAATERSRCQQWTPVQSAGRNPGRAKKSDARSARCRAGPSGQACCHAPGNGTVCPRTRR